MGECKGLNMAFQAEDAKRPWREDDETEDGQCGGREKITVHVYQDPTKTIASIFGGRAASEDKQEQKLIAQRVMFVASYDDPIADPKYLDWSEHPITFSRADQWVDILYPRCFPLILDPVI